MHFASSALFKPVPCLLICILCVGLSAQTALYVPGGSNTGGVGSSNNSNVGIGTTSPWEKLEVNGNVTLSSNGQYYRTDVYSRLWTPGQSIGSAVYIGLYGPHLTYNAKYDAGWKRISGGVAGSLGMAEGRLVYSNSTASGAAGDPITWSDRLVIEPNGNVGVGTINPTAKLEVSGGNIKVDAASRRIGYWEPDGIHDGYLVPYDGGGFLNLTSTYGTGGIKFNAGNSGAERMRITSDGNVGIGTSGPGSRLHVVGGSVYSGTIRADSPAGSYSSFGLYENGTYKASLYWHPGVQGAVFYGPSTWYFESGNVGIGTASPAHKLAVNGTVKAKEVIVETTGWSDYVFDESYQLSALSEVERFIKEKKHLPGIPTAAEVEQGGVSLGEMQTRLLAKVEEMTLHLIRLEKENAAVRTENGALQARVSLLESKVTSHP